MLKQRKVTKFKIKLYKNVAFVPHGEKHQSAFLITGVLSVFVDNFRKTFYSESLYRKWFVSNRLACRWVEFSVWALGVEQSTKERSPARHLSPHRAPLTADGLVDVSGGFAAGEQETFCGSKLVWQRWVVWSLSKVQQPGCSNNFSPIGKLCYWAVLSSDIAVKLVSGWMLDTDYYGSSQGPSINYLL